MQRREWRFKSGKKIKSVWLAIFIFLFCFCGMINSTSVMAKTDTSDPATSLTVVLNDDGVAYELASYTIEQLKNMPQVEREYSSIDRMPAPVFTAGKGLDLESFLNNQGIDMDSVSYIRFYATDNLVKKMGKDMLLDQPAYYFPKIVECWDNYWDENSQKYTDVAKASEGAAPVKPMLAITSSQGRFLPKPDWNSLDGSTCLRLCLGQVTPEECITMNFVRWVYKIEVFGKLRSGGGASSVAPRVTLSKPTANASYQVGETVQIEGTVEKLSTATLTVTDQDGHVVYTVFDLPIKDGGFSEEFTLEADTVPGSYTIEVGPAPGSSLNSKQVFQVTAAAASAASVVLNTPQAGQTVQPGDKVEISGNARGLSSAKLEVIDPAKQSVYSSTINKSGDFKGEFTLSPDALPGDYIIKINSSGLKQDYTQAFKVAQAKDTSNKNPTENKPESGIQSPTVTLKDITNHWAADRINQLIARGAIKGYPDGNFKPDSTITRAEFITTVAKAFNLSKANGKSFSDTTGHWAQNYIATATAEGIVGGYNDNIFSPDDPVTREQMAAIIVKAARLTPVAVENSFSDSSSMAVWAREAVATAVKYQVIKGYPDNTFKPGSKATRAEAAAVIVNALNLK